MWALCTAGRVGLSVSYPGLRRWDRGHGLPHEVRAFRLT